MSEEINYQKEYQKIRIKESMGIGSVVTLATIIAGFLLSLAIINTENEPEMPVSEPPKVFYYKNDTFEHLESNGYRVIYEFIDSERHIVASEPVGEGFISPLFKDKAEAIIYQQLYFDYLRNK